jgi:hypothetical protein
MRHEQIADTGSYARVDVARAAWPVAGQVTPAPVPEIAAEAADPPFLPTPAAPDVPAGAGILLLGSYLALIGSFALVTAGSALSIFAITICFLFVAIYFAVPRIFFAVEPKHGGRVSLEQFLAGGMETATGHSSGAAALVQMMIVPVLLTFGVLLIGIAKAVVL